MTTLVPGRKATRSPARVYFSEATCRDRDWLGQGQFPAIKQIAYPSVAAASGRDQRLAEVVSAVDPLSLREAVSITGSA